MLNRLLFRTTNLISSALILVTNHHAIAANKGAISTPITSPEQDINILRGNLGANSQVEVQRKQFRELFDAKSIEYLILKNYAVDALGSGILIDGKVVMTAAHVAHPKDGDWSWFYAASFGLNEEGKPKEFGAQIIKNVSLGLTTDTYRDKRRVIKVDNMYMLHYGDVSFLAKDLNDILKVLKKVVTKLPTRHQAILFLTSQANKPEKSKANLVTMRFPDTSQGQQQFGWFSPSAQSIPVQVLPASGFSPTPASMGLQSPNIGRVRMATRSDLVLPESVYSNTLLVVPNLINGRSYYVGRSGEPVTNALSQEGASGSILMLPVDNNKFILTALSYSVYPENKEQIEVFYKANPAAKRALNVYLRKYTKDTMGSILERAKEALQDERVSVHSLLSYEAAASMVERLIEETAKQKN
jgi:hypothetical protein